MMAAGIAAETVRALPMIIDGIRARGYSSGAGVTVVWQDEGRCDGALASTGQRWAARLDRLGFWLFDAGIVLITWIFFVGDLLMTGRLLFIGAAAVYDRLHEKIFGKPAEVASYNRKLRFSFPPTTKKKLLSGQFAPR